MTNKFIKLFFEIKKKELKIIPIAILCLLLIGVGFASLFLPAIVYYYLTKNIIVIILLCILNFFIINAEIMFISYLADNDITQDDDSITYGSMIIYIIVIFFNVMIMHVSTLE